MFRFVSTLQDWFFFLFQLGDRVALRSRILRPFGFDRFERVFDLCNPQRDFLLFLLELLESDDFVPNFRETGGLGSAFPPQRDLTTLQLSSNVSQRQARALAAHFQAKLAQTGADETHEEMLTKLQF